VSNVPLPSTFFYSAITEKVIFGSLYDRSRGLERLLCSEIENIAYYRNIIEIHFEGRWIDALLKEVDLGCPVNVAGEQVKSYVLLLLGLAFSSCLTKTQTTPNQNKRTYKIF